MKYKFLSHTADVKFQAFGKSLEECFTNSFFALKKVMFDNLKIKQVILKKIKVKGKDYESLLYNFLEEFLYLLDAKEFISFKIKNIKIHIDKKDKFILSAELIGDKTKNYKFSNSVKAVTYNEMFVKKENKKWISQVVLDV
jgi:SHS2 domain-containing protein